MFHRDLFRQIDQRPGEAFRFAFALEHGLDPVGGFPRGAFGGLMGGYPCFLAAVLQSEVVDFTAFQDLSHDETFGVVLL
ncbi:hypothetical protein SDC9_189610 [bioreactor metagenome]|uniref:Uncharacterized protein n=1 Tax=bioreactor metagenome TaxID=1076179 RepID=A0A645I0U6_9ZZZZ